MGKIIKYYRMYDWWNFILPPIFSFYLIGILDSRIFKSFDNDDFCQFFLFLLLATHTAMFGFALGEISDMEDDSNAGKANTFLNLSVLMRRILLLYPLFVIGIVLIPINFSILQYLLFCLQLICFILYSLKPFRFKRNKVFAVILDATYSGTLFYMIAFLQFCSDYRILALIAIWGILRGVRNILYHLMQDKINDEKIGIVTLATNNNISNMRKYIYHILIPMEYIAANSTLFFMPYNYVYMIFFNLYMLYIVNRKTYIIPYVLKRKIAIHSDYIVGLNLFYESILLLCCSIHLLIQDFGYVFLIIAILLLFPKSIISWVNRGIE